MNKEPADKKITLDKLAQMIEHGFASVRADIREVRADISNLETKLEEVSETVNAHTLKLDNLASKHDLETMLEKSWSLALLKANMSY